MELANEASNEGEISPSWYAAEGEEGATRIWPGNAGTARLTSRSGCGDEDSIVVHPRAAARSREERGCDRSTREGRDRRFLVESDPVSTGYSG